MNVTLPIYQVDAFAERVFEGNPAAVCPLDAWLPDETLQAIALENNLAETAFFVPSARGYRLRWFTPVDEVDLCGHATLASAHVLFEIKGHPDPEIVFETRSGDLVVTRVDQGLSMDFPSRPPAPCATPPALVAGLGATPVEVLESDDYLAVFATEADVAALAPDFAALSRLGRRGVIATAPGTRYDFVSRFFAPRLGVNEDAVTGSAHCELAPYWAARLGRRRLHARQISARGGDVGCELLGDRVMLTGRAVTFLRGHIDVHV